MSDEQKLAEVVSILTELRDMKGYPDKSSRLIPVAEMLLRMCQNGPVEHDKLGHIPNDIRWLIRFIGDTHDFFPSRAEMRRIYTAYFPPRDGLTTGYAD